MQIHSLFKRLYFCLVCLGAIGFTSCQKGELSLGDDFINFPTYTALIDTVTMQLSTIKNDSIVTSNTNNALIGYYHHPIMGGQEAQSYFSLAYSSDFSWDNDKQVFDSLVVILHSNAYSIGDTSIDAHINVHRLTQKIETNSDGELYNTSAFTYDENPLANHRFRPFPVGDNQVSIRVDDAFAHELIEFYITYNNHVDKASLFAEQFYGLLFKCDTNLTRSALGYMVNDTANYLRLYSHKSELEQSKMVDDFALSGSSGQFNQLQSTDESVVFNQIPNGKSLLKAQDSGNIVLLQSGAGLRFRADFPSMNNLLELQNKGYIVKAELRLKPDMSRMKSADLPPTLYIGDIYRANETWGYLTDSDGNTLTSQLNIDNIYHENTYYAFNITDYFNQRLSDPVIDTSLGLVFTLPDNDMGSTYTWLAINGQTHTNTSSELLLYYYYYDTE